MNNPNPILSALLMYFVRLNIITNHFRKVFYLEYLYRVKLFINFAGAYFRGISPTFPLVNYIFLR